MTTDKPAEQAPIPTPKARTRSPAYPSLSLKSAIEKAKVVWEHEKRNPVQPEALAADWGTNAKSSSTLLAISSLKKFGLLEEVEGAKDRALKLSQSALNIILNDQEDSAERILILKQCALTPKIHADLWTLYNGDLPSDANLRRHLIVEKNFNADSVDGFIKQFRDTISFAKLSPSDKITVATQAEAEDSDETPLLQQKPVVEGIRSVTAPGTPLNTFLNPTVSVLREFNFPLPTGVATLKVPFPLTEEDYAALFRTLKIFKGGLVKSEPPTLDTSSPDWEQQAESFAKQKIEFNVVNFSYSHHIEAVERIAELGAYLPVRFNPKTGQAFFKRPESEFY